MSEESVVWHPDRRLGNRPGATRTHDDSPPRSAKANPQADRQLATPSFGLESPGRACLIVRPPPMVQLTDETIPIKQDKRCEPKELAVEPSGTISDEYAKLTPRRRATASKSYSPAPESARSEGSRAVASSSRNGSVDSRNRGPPQRRLSMGRGSRGGRGVQAARSKQSETELEIENAAMRERMEKLEKDNASLKSQLNDLCSGKLLEEMVARAVAERDRIRNESRSPERRLKPETKPDDASEEALASASTRCTTGVSGTGGTSLLVDPRRDSEAVYDDFVSSSYLPLASIGAAGSVYTPRGTLDSPALRARREPLDSPALRPRRIISTVASPISSGYGADRRNPEPIPSPNFVTREVPNAVAAAISRTLHQAGPANRDSFERVEIPQTYRRMETASTFDPFNPPGTQVPGSPGRQRAVELVPSQRPVLRDSLRGSAGSRTSCLVGSTQGAVSPRGTATATYPSVGTRGEAPGLTLSSSQSTLRPRQAQGAVGPQAISGVRPVSPMSGTRVMTSHTEVAKW